MRDGIGTRCRAAFGKRMFQVDQHDNAKFRRDTRQRDESDASRHRLVVAKQIEQPDPASQRKRQGEHHQRRLVKAAEGGVKQREDDEKGDGDDDLQSLDGALEIFELASVGDADAGRQFHLGRDGGLQIADDFGQRPATAIDIDPGCRPAIFAAQHRRALRDADVGNRAEGDLLKAGGEHWQVADGIDAAAQLARVTHADRVARQPLHRLADGFAADGARHDCLHVGDVHAIACGGGAVDLHIDITAAGEPFGER